MHGFVLFRVLFDKNFTTLFHVDRTGLFAFDALSSFVLFEALEALLRVVQNSHNQKCTKCHYEEGQYGIKQQIHPLEVESKKVIVNGLILGATCELAGRIVYVINIVVLIAEIEQYMSIDGHRQQTVQAKYFVGNPWLAVVPGEIDGIRGYCAVHRHSRQYKTRQVSAGVH